MESEVFPDRYFDEFSDAERHQWYIEHSAEIAELEDLSKEIDRLKKQENSSDIITDLGTVIGKDHVLLKYYPELDGIVVHITYMPYNVGGHYGLDVITLNREAMYDRNTLNHEVQHAIQEIEGFARGGSMHDVRNRIMKRIAELDNVSEHAKEMLARQVEYRALASKLGYVYERLMENGEDWAVRAASDNYWEAMNTLDNDENSRLNNVYPNGKNASEIAKEGFNRDKAIEELNRLSDYYASQISAEDMKNIKASETLSGKIDGKSDEELYHALGGEVEARNVQSRLGMTAEERRASLASETEDVAREDQIFLEDGLGVIMSESASETDLEDVNRRFNERLIELFSNPKQKDRVLHLGMASKFLQESGISNAKIILEYDKLVKKSKEDYKNNHPFSISDIKDLPLAIHHPIAVFDNTNGKDAGRVILTELKKDGRNFIVVVQAREQQHKGGVLLEINEISTLYPKEAKGILKWIIDKNYTNIDKKKALRFIEELQPHAGTTIKREELDSAAKVVEDFKNPKDSDMKSDGNFSSDSTQASAATTESTDTAKYRIREDEPPRTMQEDRDMMRSVAEQMGEKLHTNIHIIEDVNEITHPNSAVQERRRRSKGWYDTKTGQVNIVLPNNRSVDDVKASVGHETVAHKGLRELIGEENYDAFLDEVYEHLRGDLKQQVDTQASRAFIDDATRNGERAKSYEQHRRTAVDELFGRLAEKPFEEFAEGERTLWQKIKEAVRKVLDEFLGTLNLPKWFELGDNELRYILWRSKERLERGREHPIDLARDIVKREELGLTDEARYNMGDVAGPSFASRRDRAVKEHGYVHPGLNTAEVKVVPIKEKSPFDTSKKTKPLKEDVVAYANEHGIIGTMTEEETKGKGKVTISKASIEKMVDDSATGKSVDKDTHLAIIPQLREVIAESVMAETHPDYNKGRDGKRSPENGYNPDNLIHRCYGAISIDGQEYRIKLTLKETSGNRKSKKAYSYEVTKIELLISGSPTSNALSNSIGEVLDGQTTKPLSVSSRKSNTPNGVELLDSTDGERTGLSSSYQSNSNGVGTLNSELEGYPLAKLLQNVGKSYEKGKNLLDESKLADESADLYREVGETDDIWSDGSLGLHERMTAAAARLSANHKDNKTLRNDAMRAIGSNLFDLRKAMSLQRTFDKITAKRVADLARVLMNSGHLSGLTQQEVKRLMAAIRDSVGRENIDESIQKIMDIMVDNQLKHAEATLHELESIKGSKVDARGVEVQGQLDPDGQTLIKAMKEAQKIVNPCGGKTHDEKGEPTAWGNALESAQMRISSKTISLMESG